MTDQLTRRRFVTYTAMSGVAVAGAVAGKARAQAPSDRVTLAVMGMSRGRAVAAGFAGRPNTFVKYVCDVDEQRAVEAVKEVGAAATANGQPAPTAVVDFRRTLEDAEVDAVVIATPDHWHAPMAILAMQAGKHVYVEKPCSHNPREGELLIEAARRYGKACQMGNQRRSYPGNIEAIRRIHEGVVGRVYHARGWYGATRTSIGRGNAVAPPARLDYDLWQGPAPRVPYRDNVVHYNWHWFWDWGTGEAGNNGVHAIDLCRWGLGVGYPTRVTSSGGRYAFDDDQQTPDTHTACFEFEDRRSITWECLSCNPCGPERTGFGASFHGNGGTVIIRGGGYVILDTANKVVEEHDGPTSDDPHYDDFLAAIRDEKPLNLRSEIEGGHQSTLLCQLANIAHRTGRALLTNPADGHIRNDADAMKMWSRTYQSGWEPKLT